MRDHFLFPVIASLIWFSLFISGLFLWFCPLVLFYAWRTRGWKPVFVTAALSVLLVNLFYVFLLSVKDGGAGSTFFDFFPGFAYYPSFGSFGVQVVVLVYSLFLVMVGLCLSWGSRRETKVFPLLFKTASVSVLVVAFGLLVVWKGDVTAWMRLADQYFSSIVQQLVQIQTISGNDSEELRFIQQNQQMLTGVMVALLPGFVVGTVFVLVWLNISVAYKFLRKHAPFKNLVSPLHLQVPFGFVWGVILALAVFVGTIYFFQQTALKWVAVNSLIAFSLLYFLQGGSVLVSLFELYAVRSWVRYVLFGFLIVTFQFSVIGLAFLGFFDTWFNFRKVKLEN